MNHLSYILQFYFSGDFLNAIEYYQQAVDLNPQLPQALNNLAVIYHYQGTKAAQRKELQSGN